MQRLFKHVSVLIAILLLSACATPMGLNSKTRDLDLRTQSVVLISVELSRSEARTVPWPRGVNLIPVAAKSRSEAILFKIDEEGMDYTDGTRYVALIRANVPPGRYVVEQVWGEIKKFPFAGMWHAPLALQV